MVGYLQNSLLIVDARDGRVLHRRPLSTGYDEHSAWPLYREPDLVLTRPFRLSAECLRLQATPDDVVNARLQWSSNELANDIDSSVLVGEHIYGFDLKELQASRHRKSRGSFRCLAWATGKTAWSTDRVGHAAVLAADGKLFLLNDSGELILARADPERYTELGRARIFDGETCWTVPALDRGRLYLRSPSRLVCVQVGRDEQAVTVSSQQAPSPSNWRLDSNWLLTREREYPNDAFSAREMLLWFAVCVLIFAAAALATEGGRWAVRRGLNRQMPRTLPCLGLAFVVSLLGPNLLSATFDTCLFTWPAALYAAFHATVWVGWWAQWQDKSSRAGWLARLTLLLFLLVNYAFFELCRAVGMFVAWSFLVGFLPCLPFTLLAVRAEWKNQRSWLIAAWTLLAFATFFWSVQGFLVWKTWRAT
jgi:hypothetical protein